MKSAPIALAAALLATAPVPAAEITTYWNDSSFYGDWNESSNWSAGVPNNDLSHTYTAAFPPTPLYFQPFTATISSPITISNLDLNGSSISVATPGTLTVAGSTTFGPPVVFGGSFVQNYGGSIFTSSAVADLGTVNQWSGGVLSVGSLQANFNGIIQWSGAAVTTIGQTASVTLGTNSFLKDSGTGTDALSSLASNQGALAMQARDFSTAGNFSNTGALSVGDATFTINGQLLESNGGTLTAGALNVQGGGTIEWAAADIHTIAENASVNFFGAGGSLKDTTSGLSALRNLSQIDGTLSLYTNTSTVGGLVVGENGSISAGSGALLTVDGNLANTGRISADGYGNDFSSDSALIHVNGTVALQAGNTLAGGNWSVSAYNDGSGSATATIEWADADIQSIGAAAAVTIRGATSTLKDTTTGLSALRNLSNIDGSLDISDQPLTTPGPLTIGSSGGLSINGGSATIGGDFSNAGYLRVQAPSFDALNQNTVFHVDGAVAQQVGNTLTGGSWSAYNNNDPAATATIEWAGADIHTIGESASVSLDGTGSSLRDSTSGLSALRNLSTVDGGLYLSNQSFATPGALSIGEFGTVYAQNGTSITIAGDLSNAGSLSSTAYTYSSSDQSTLIHIDGAVAQQVGTTLTGGGWNATASSQDTGIATATIEWANADIHTISENASVNLEGNGASLRDTTTGLSALRNLSTVDGTLILTDQSLATPGPLTVGNNGDFEVTSSNVTIAGNLSNAGSLSTFGFGFPSSDQSSIIHVDGTVAQQVGTTLTGGSWNAFSRSFDDAPASATIEWANADIHTIGADATIGLRGAGASLKDTSSGLSALRNLNQVDGSLSLSETHLNTTSNVLINGDLSVSGTSASTLDGSLSFSSTGNYIVNFQEIYDPNTGETTGITAGGFDINGTAFLGGTLKLSFDDVYSFIPDAGSQYEILDAATVSGFFLNATNGSRVDVIQYDDTTIGSFAVSYTGTSVTLTDFQAIPEPGTWALLFAGGLCLLFTLRKRKRA